MIPEDIVRAAWVHSEGFCECTRPSHNHYNIKCHKRLDWNSRGLFDSPGGWEIHQTSTSIKGSHSCYEVLCSECYKLVAG